MSDSMAASGSEAPNEQEEPSLSKLLAALAMGARAVHNLPLEDDYDYQSSFPEFSQLAKETNDRLIQVLGVALPDLDSDDPQLWETCADACDALLEQAESYAASGNTTAIAQSLQDFSQTARQKAKGGYGRMVAGLVDMEKPQQTCGIKVQNDRTQPFVPRVHPDKPYGTKPLDLTFQDGNGLESRFYGTTRAVLPNVVAPAQHVPHVYQEELLSLEYRAWQLQAPATKPPVIAKTAVEDLSATWVDSTDELQKLAKRLESVNIVAVDLEAHSFRSFAGLTCLMQLTLEGGENYLVDTLKLWNEMNQYLAPIFANPDIVKVMHGADSDVQWLQRDFGIYVVNLFDTGRAARALKFTSAGLAYLLQHYVGVQADKTHQLSDWRQRPLPDSMQAYAIMDTYYLLDIYQHLLWDLEQHPDTSIEDVLNASRDVCLIRYDKEPFQPDGYKSLHSSRRKSRSELTQQQDRVLSSLFDWRDQTARDFDESITYVCSHQALLRISMACPRTVTALQTLMNPMPPLVMRLSDDVLSRIKHSLEEGEDDDDEEEAEIAGPGRVLGAPSSAFFKPAEVDDAEGREDNGILSPVLATEEMYKQAGWMTPQVADVITTTTDDDDGDSSSKPRKLLVVDDANQGYQSKEYTTHSLAMGRSWEDEKGGRGRTTDGLGPARVAGDTGEDVDVEQEARHAQLNAVSIRSGMSQDEDLLGSISSTVDLEEATRAEGTAGARHDPSQEEVDGDSDEEFVIPKSMREIYKISNQNRRNKNSISPTNLERSGVAPEEMVVDTLAGASAMLAASVFYGENEGGKRQRTKSDAADGGGAAPSRDENIEFMKGLGWIKSKEELEAKMGRPRDEGEDATEIGGEENADRESPTDGESRASKGSSAGISNKSGSPFDYANIGPIGVFNPGATPPTNPFFAGAAVAPMPSNQGPTTKRTPSDRKKGAGRGKSGRSGKQERPDKKDGRAFVYKKR